MIERSRLAEILETYGANPARWPEGERAAAEAALAADPGLQAVAARERLLDGWLSDWEMPAPARRRWTPCSRPAA
ncbi:hypothetical protein [Pedomonas mirosovicensis]|uniref:hypothetical protein n=1 Tax=Pedomonas mirosovicensis TaxID=2908641 RepID=UPI00216857F4|nr:hypothetical protein [Pedomonas mirosovicensis]MCH8684585.1 hypothetical protein [Pedomonas mirosovicensis]